MQPTLRQVPPRAPRFSMHAVCGGGVSLWAKTGAWRGRCRSCGYAASPSLRCATASVAAHLQAELGGLDGGHVAARATADNDDVVGLGGRGEAAAGDARRTDDCGQRHGLEGLRGCQLGAATRRSPRSTHPGRSTARRETGKHGGQRRAGWRRRLSGRWARDAAAAVDAAGVWSCEGGGEVVELCEDGRGASQSAAPDPTRACFLAGSRPHPCRACAVRRGAGGHRATSPSAGGLPAPASAAPPQQMSGTRAAQGRRATSGVSGAPPETDRGSDART
jgi:hypothetical protein